MKSKEADLGHGWQAKLHYGETSGAETLVLRNPESGGFINLPDESVKRLRAIFAEVDAKAFA